MKNIISKGIDQVILFLLVISLVGALISTNLANTYQFGFIVGTLIIFGMVLAVLPLPKDKVGSLSRFFKQPWLFFLVVLAYQVLLVVSLTGEIGYDAYTIKHAAMGNPDYYYFSVYPNNLGLLFLMRFLYVITHALGITNFTLALNFINIIFIDITIFLIWYFLKKYLKKSILWGLFPFAFLLAPWLVVFYSDTTVLPFTAAMIVTLYELLQNFNNKQYSAKKLYGLSAIFGISTFCAYALKPSTFIFVIAIVVELALNLLIKPFPKRSVGKILTRQVGLIVAVMILSFGVLKVGETVLVDHQHLVAVNKEVAMQPSHFILMGMNQKSGGRFSDDDYHYSTSFKNPKAQNSGNWRLIRQRLKKIGAVNYIRFLFVKNYTNTSDGTLGWSNDSQFSKTPSLNKNKFIRSFFFLYGSRQAVYFVIAQLTWIIILSGVIFSFFDRSLFVRILRMSVLGLLLFLLIFEGGRSRYLIQSFPVIYILAVIGWHQLYKRVITKKKITISWHSFSRLF